MTSMRTAPLVSVLTPAYNAAAFIADTVTSVLAQTLPDLELIVADDGSTDDTTDVVRDAARGDPRVVVIASPHGGPATARNAAFAVARGRFVALLDSDDVWMPGYLEEQVRLAERCPDAGVVTANAINRGGDFDGRPLWPATAGLRRLTLHDLVVEENAVCIMSLFRREIFEQVGGFDPHFTGNEDYEFWLRVANADVGIVQNRRVLGYYRRRPGSVSSDEVRTTEGIVRVLTAASSWSGPAELERETIEAKLVELRDQLARARLRASLLRRDGREAASRLHDLSRLRGSVPLAIAARLTRLWPALLVRAYGWRRASRTS